MKKGSVILGLLLLVSAALAQESTREEPLLYNPYERPKNGPPLSNIVHKVEFSWLLKKLLEPSHHPSARMPDFQFSEEEALDIMAYLNSVAGEPPARIQWPSWATKTFEEMDDPEMEAMFQEADQGKAVWGDARCTICHLINGPGGELTGGFVDLRVGGMDLQIAATKLKRDWLYAWIKEPKEYFPDTLMPRYRFSDGEIKALVEYILRDDAFLPFEEIEERPELWSALDEPERVSRGKHLMELSRCVLCHDVEGIPELLTFPELKAPPPGDTFESLAYDVRCLSCHSIQGRGGTYAPDLTSEGSRLQTNWIAQFVQAPDMVRPLSQQMPKFNLSSREAQLIADYMSSRRLDTSIPTQIPGGPLAREEIQRGNQAFQDRGCLSCHTVGEGPGGVVGPDLVLAKDRLREGYLWFHLKSPHQVNRHSAEPDYSFSDEEARDLAAYLARGVR